MKKIFVAAVVALLLLLIITSIGLASLPRTEASGTFITTSTTINRVTEDKFNTMIDLNSRVTYTGTLEGTSTLQGTLTIHHDESGSFQGVEIFTGLVNGIPGTLIFKLKGNSDLYQAIRLNNVITSSAGELVGLQGELTKAGIIKDDGPIGTYTGHISNQ